LLRDSLPQSVRSLCCVSERTPESRAMILPRRVDDYLEEAQGAEERARDTTDLDLKARWLGIASGYRELARFRQQARNKVLPPDSSIRN